MPRLHEVNEKMRQASIHNIIKTSTELFAERGFFTCKMSDIAKAAGMSVGNLYWYYKGKDDVLKAVLQSGFEYHRLQLERFREADDFIDNYLKTCIEQKDFLMLLLSFVSSNGFQYIRDLGYDITDIGYGFHEMLSSTFGFPEKLPEDELRYLPSFFLSFFLGLTVSFGNELENIPPKYIRSAAYRLLNINKEGS